MVSDGDDISWHAIRLCPPELCVHFSNRKKKQSEFNITTVCICSNNKFDFYRLHVWSVCAHGQNDAFRARATHTSPTMLPPRWLRHTHTHRMPRPNGFCLSCATRRIAFYMNSWSLPLSAWIELNMKYVNNTIYIHMHVSGRKQFQLTTLDIDSIERRSPSPSSSSSVALASCTLHTIHREFY